MQRCEPCARIIGAVHRRIAGNNFCVRFRRLVGEISSHALSRQLVALKPLLIHFVQALHLLTLEGIGALD
jgi:hypothetical protein